MEKLGVQPYFTTYVYLIALAADAQEWPWVEFLLAEAMARQWEVVKHRSDTREDSEVPCSICLEDFRMRPQVILSCSHVFHGECLRSFERFAGKRQCPLCRCPYFDATIHHSGLMVWRKKCASRIQRAWRGYLSRKELFNELRLPSVRKEAPTLPQPQDIEERTHFLAFLEFSKA
eukprot:g30960.t1